MPDDGREWVDVPLSRVGDPSIAFSVNKVARSLPEINEGGIERVRAKLPSVLSVPLHEPIHAIPLAYPPFIKVKNPLEREGRGSTSNEPSPREKLEALLNAKLSELHKRLDNKGVLFKINGVEQTVKIAELISLREIVITWKSMDGANNRRHVTPLELIESNPNLALS